MADNAQPAPAKIASFKRNMSLQVSNPTTDVLAAEPEPEVDVAPTPTLDQVDAAFGKELEAMQKEGATK
ncbi:hypothetical protein HYH03_010739 [Edaphochlamys debaryana]|uniref:Uncharacterized protein n=1 Tax=Edaphochlamys debaryana TaxID=47281 RepID=A0A835XTB2_9CHLO|nr:hypothetical protein HYH03_010739 [Edaphochlamys debaryana]|eukprot:KAG2490817.1 hypothetical protein HYH03_010739 [Edaphochlamys debaryana]